MYDFDNRLLLINDYGIGLVKVRGRGEREGGEMEERRGEEERGEKDYYRLDLIINWFIYLCIT